VFSAVLDACVLYPVRVRDTLLSIAQADIYRPLWTDQIVEEAVRNIVDKRSDLDPVLVRKSFSEMDAAFPDARVTEYEPLISAMTNHTKDRHVLAAALAGAPT
jgi:hypothetical protein